MKTDQEPPAEGGRLKATLGPGSLSPLFKRRRRLLIILVAAVLAVLLLFFGRPALNKIKDSLTKKPESPAPRVLTPYEQADTLNFGGKYEDAQKLLDSHIDKAATDQEKGNLFESKALLALNKQLYDQAVSYAKAADQLNPTVNAATLAALAAEGLGDKQLALDFYRKVVERIDQETREASPADYEYYLNKVKELGG